MMTLFKHALRTSFSQPINIIVIFILPLPILAIPDQSNGFPNGLYLYGMVNLYSAFLLCKPIIEDRMSRVIVRISATPTSYITYLSSHLLAYMMILIIQNIIFITGLFVFWDKVVFDFAYIFGLYFVFSIMTLCFVLFWNTLFRSYNLSLAIFSGVASVMCLVSGISIPFHFFPAAFQKLMMILPTYWLPYGLKMIYNGKIIKVFISYIVLLSFSGIFLLIGSKRRY
jgi:ABC-2 type transport system permease protein